MYQTNAEAGDDLVEDTSPGSGKHGHIVGGEDMVVLDDTSETGKDDPLDDDHQISTTSDDVIGGIGGEGAELHPEFDDDFEDDDQQFEVLETADGDFSEDSHSVDQSPSVSDSPSEKDMRRDKESGKREKATSEKSGTVYISRDAISVWCDITVFVLKVNCCHSDLTAYVHRLIVRLCTAFVEEITNVQVLLSIEGYICVCTMSLTHLLNPFPLHHF